MRRAEDHKHLKIEINKALILPVNHVDCTSLLLSIISFIGQTAKTL